MIDNGTVVNMNLTVFNQMMLDRYKHSVLINLFYKLILPYAALAWDTTRGETLTAWGIGVFATCRGRGEFMKTSNRKNHYKALILP